MSMRERSLRRWAVGAAALASIAVLLAIVAPARVAWRRAAEETRRAQRRAAAAVAVAAESTSRRYVALSSGQFVSRAQVGLVLGQAGLSCR